jgi:cobalt/nickel transport system permease protein
LKIDGFLNAQFRRWTLVCAGLFVLATPCYAMHIPEGVLPPQWAGLWYLVAIPFVLWGLRDLKVRNQKTPLLKPMVALVGAAIFVISCMPIPVPVAGSCSHPCGTGLAAILIGPQLTVLVTSIALLLQALFLSHGGLTTLGANITSMGVAGAFGGYAIFHLARYARVPVLVAAFLAGVLSDWLTYATTSLELASALHGTGPLWKMFGAIALAFLPTQLPLGIIEGFMAAGVYRFILLRRPSLLESLGLAKAGVA